MKVKCNECGLVLEKCLSLGCVCPECGSSFWHRLDTEKKIDREMLEMREDLVRMRDIAKKWVENWDNLKKQEDLIRDDLKGQDVPTMMEATIKERAKREREEGLAFEIFEVVNQEKVNVRKLYIDGHIEGFEGDPCIINHIFPKIMALKAVLKQMNKDYRDLIEAYMIRGLPLDQVPLHELYLREMEGIDNIKI